MAQSSSSVVATSRSKSEDIASSWAKSKARSASWRGETSNRSGDRRKEKRWRHTLFLRARLLRYRSSEPGTAAGVAHACGNVALLRHLARDLRRTGSRFPSASPAKTEAGSHRWRRSSPLMNSLAIQPRWQAVVELWLAFLVTQRRLKPAAEGYQVCAGEEHEDEHPHFSGHDLTLSQILRGARNELSLLNDAQWSPESPPLTIRPAPRIFRNWRQFANSLHSAYSARYACLMWEPALAAPQNRC